MEPASVITVPVAASIMGVCEEYVRRLVRQGKLRVAGRIGRSLVFDRADLDAWREAKLTRRLGEGEPTSGH